jgi:hypothetical protein
MDVVERWLETQKHVDAALDFLCDPEADIDTILAIEEHYAVTWS